MVRSNIYIETCQQCLSSAAGPLMLIEYLMCKICKHKIFILVVTQLCCGTFQSSESKKFNCKDWDIKFIDTKEYSGRRILTVDGD